MARKKNSFEQSLLRIEEIVKLLENGDVTLENSIELYKEGMSLFNFCNEKLEQAQNEIIMLADEDTFKLQITND